MDPEELASNTAAALNTIIQADRRFTFIGDTTKYTFDSAYAKGPLVVVKAHTNTAAYEFVFTPGQLQLRIEE